MQNRDNARFCCRRFAQSWYNKVPKGKPLQFIANFLFPEVSKLKRQITFVLVFLLCVLPLAACDNKEKTQESKENLTYEINKNIFADIGLTLEQLQEKYGPSVLEERKRDFRFDVDKCVGIESFTAEELLSNYENGMTPEEVAELYEMKLLTTRMYSYEFGSRRSSATKAFFTVDGLIVTLGLEQEKGEKIGYDTSNNGVFTVDEFNIVRYQNLYFNPKGIDSRYQVFGEVAIGVPEDATIEDFLNDPLADAIKDAWLPGFWRMKQPKFFGDEGEVTSGKLTPGMRIDAGTAEFSVIPYVEELEQQ